MNVIGFIFMALSIPERVSREQKGMTLPVIDVPAIRWLACSTVNVTGVKRRLA